MAPSPIGDAYVTADRLGEYQGKYPLDLYLCLDCGHAQNVDVIDPEILFRDYIYVTSSSLGLVEHYRRYADDVTRVLRVGPNSLIVEIGSNDGTLLKFFRDKGMRVVGVDPAREIAATATRDGVPTLPEFFSSPLATKIRAEYGAAEIVAANNVYAHADNLADITRGIHDLLSDTGVFVFEVSYLADIIDGFLFDTIYHEHVSYHSIAPLARFFASHGMELFDIWRNASKGGSIRGFARRKRAAASLVAPVVQELIQHEAERKLATPAPFKRFAQEIALRKSRLLEFLDQHIARGARIAGYGASTTVTTLIYQFDLQSRLEFIADDNPRKCGRFSPEAHIPVLPSDELYVRKPEFCVILAWNYAEQIAARHPGYLRQGGRFIVPLPEFRILDSPTTGA
jgi:SAM-dependent methyltransferase